MANIQQSVFPTNRLLASFTADDFSALEPFMTVSTVHRGDVLIEQGVLVKEVHLPLTADLSNRKVLQDGSAVETSAVGPSDVSGLAAFLADEPIAWEVRVQRDGDLIRLPAARLREQVMASQPLMRLLLSLTHAHQARSAQIAVCNAVHPVTARVARVLLATADRTGSPEILITQDELAEQLGAQRTTISAAAVMLKTAGAIRYMRGRVTIRNRAVLQSCACQCYRVEADF
ncbi:MAG: Crp/Fnr family transcriptional regulator [Brevundimonas sp.]